MGVRSSLCALIAVGYLGAVGASGAIVQHVGANNPTTEGWTFDSGDPGNIAVGPVFNDAGSGYDAWKVDDNSNSYGLYVHNFSAGELTSLSGKNWIAGVRVNQPGLDTAADGDVYLDVHYGTKRFLVYFGTQADGNPTWKLQNATLAAINGLGAGYHLYEFRYNAATTTADFYVDGQLAFDDYAGAAAGTSRIAFGSAAGVPKDQGNYNLVTMTLDPIPEPAALSLLGLGGLALNRQRR